MCSLLGDQPRKVALGTSIEASMMKVMLPITAKLNK